MNPKRRRGKNTISANFNFWIVVEWLIIIRGLKYEQTQELGKRTNLPLCCCRFTERLVVPRDEQAGQILHVI
jgi:hypothetical protein